MNKKELINLGFIYNKRFDEFCKESSDKSNDTLARVYFYKFNKFLIKNIKIGKLHWNNIIIIFDHKKKPILIIHTIYGFSLTIYNNYCRISQGRDLIWKIKESHKFDHWDIEFKPEFTSINFIGEFNWTININKLRKWKT